MLQLRPSVGKEEGERQHARLNLRLLLFSGSAYTYFK